MKIWIRVAFAIALACLAAPASLAQTYPNRPIRLIAPYEPGGGTDALARLVGRQLSEVLGQPVVVENRPGAGGTIGAQYVVSSPPDGYTLLLASPSPIVVMPHLRKQLSYDPLKDLAPITLITEVPAILVVNKSVPVHSVQELIALAKAEPGKLTFGSSGIGGTSHLAGELLKSMTHIDMLHVPYKGTGPANTALLGEQVTMSFSDIISTVQLVKDGRLRALAVTTTKRSPILPDVPAVAETLPGYSASVWFGIFAPAKTPAAIIDKLNRTVVEILNDAGFRQRLTALGGTPVGDSPSEYAAFLKEDTERWGSVIHQAGIPPE